MRGAGKAGRTVPHGTGARRSTPFAVGVKTGAVRAPSTPLVRARTVARIALKDGTLLGGTVGMGGAAVRTTAGLEASALREKERGAPVLSKRVLGREF